MILKCSAIIFCCMCSITFLELASAFERVDILLALPLTSIDERTKQRIQNNDSSLEELAVAAQAIRDAKAFNLTLAPELNTFNCRDTEIIWRVIDTGLSPKITIQQYLKYKEVVGNSPDFIIGPGRSSTSVAMSLISAADDVAIMGYSATTNELDDTEVHQNFARMVPSDETIALAFSKLMEYFEYPQIALIYIDDSSGRALKDTIYLLCRGLGITVDFFPFSGRNQESISLALKNLEESKLNVVLSIIYDEDLQYMMETAYDLGLAGPGKLWIFTDSINEKVALRLANQHSTFAKAIKGSLRILSKPIENELSQEFRQMYSSFDQMLDTMKLRLNFDVTNSLYIDTLNETEMPQNIEFPSDFLQGVVPRNAFYIYDAIITLIRIVRINACKTTYQDGRGEWYMRKITNGKLNFTGVSGRVEFDEKGNRNPSTVRYPIYTFSGNFANLELREVGEFKWDTKSWMFPNSIFEFSDGSAKIEFTNAPVLEDNKIDPGLRITSYILGSVVIFLAVLTGIWTWTNSNQPVIKAAQPRFLFLALVGVIVSSSSIFWQGYNALGAKPFCHVQWWCISIGLTLVTSALSAKLYRIYRVFMNKSLKRVKTSNVRVLLTIAAVLAVNIVILASLTYFVPMTWTETILSEDEFGQTTESYSSCKAQDADENEYLEPLLWAVLGLFHIVQYVVGGVLAYRTRNVPSDFQEAHWIAISVFTQIQLILFGVPAILAIKEKETGLRFFFQSILVTLVNGVFVFLLFFPKLQRLNYNFGIRTCFSWCGLVKRSTIKKVSVTYGDSNARGTYTGSLDTSFSSAPPPGNQPVVKNKMFNPSSDTTGSI